MVNKLIAGLVLSSVLFGNGSLESVANTTGTNQISESRGQDSFRDNLIIFGYMGAVSLSALYATRSKYFGFR